MARQLDPSTTAALAQPTIYPVIFLRIDIQGDPLYVWSGLHPITMSGTGDLQMDGITFDVGAHLAEFSSITDSADGSQPVSITLAGIDPTLPILKQIVWDGRIWQFRQAWIWLGLLDTDGNIVGKPIRLKTGRLDKLTYAEQDGSAKITANIEGHQAWAGTSLNSKWSTQNQLDGSDTSQGYVVTLANKQPTLGGIGSSFPTSSSNSSEVSASNRYGSRGVFSVLE